MCMESVAGKKRNVTPPLGLEPLLLGDKTTAVRTGFNLEMENCTIYDSVNLRDVINCRA